MEYKLRMHTHSHKILHLRVGGDERAHVLRVVHHLLHQRVVQHLSQHVWVRQQLLLHTGLESECYRVKCVRGYSKLIYG